MFLKMKFDFSDFKEKFSTKVQLANPGEYFTNHSPTGRSHPPLATRWSINEYTGIEILKQECIPVGCVPTAAVAATRCQSEGGVSIQGVSIQRGVSIQIPPM